jgi:spore coat protein CotH
MQLAQADLGQAANWSQLESLLDVNDFIDYMLVNYYIGNGDWAHHNWYASYNRSDPAGRWRFHSWDAEKGLHRVTDDVTNRDDSGGPTFFASPADTKPTLPHAFC